MNAATPAKPLAGWRVLVPRGGKWGDGVAATLRGFGAIPVIAPLINFAGAEDPSALANALRRAIWRCSSITCRLAKARCSAGE